MASLADLFVPAFSENWSRWIVMFAFSLTVFNAIFFLAIFKLDSCFSFLGWLHIMHEFLLHQIKSEIFQKGFLPPLSALWDEICANPALSVLLRTLHFCFLREKCHKTLLVFFFWPTASKIGSNLWLICLQSPQKLLFPKTVFSLLFKHPFFSAIYTRVTDPLLQKKSQQIVEQLHAEKSGICLRKRYKVFQMQLFQQLKSATCVNVPFQTLLGRISARKAGQRKKREKIGPHPAIQKKKLRHERIQKWVFSLS